MKVRDVVAHVLSFDGTIADMEKVIEGRISDDEIREELAQIVTGLVGRREEFLQQVVALGERRSVLDKVQQSLNNTLENKELQAEEKEYLEGVKYALNVINMERRRALDA